MAITVDGIKITQYRSNYAQTNYAKRVLGNYTTIDGEKHNITIKDFINEITEEYYNAAKIYNRVGADAANQEAIHFKMALWGYVGYTGKDSTDTIIKGFSKVWNTGKNGNRSFVNGVNEDNRKAFDWACKHPVKYVGEKLDYYLAGGVVPDNNNTDDILKLLKPYAKYALYGLGIYFLIKAIK